jgi:hypothetical protein
MPSGPRRTGRETPPNLRPTDGNRMCGNCAYFEGMCRMYDYPVDAGEVCDSWYPRGSSD